MECNFSGEYVHELAGEMCLTGTWILDEIRLAIQKGYEALDIIEVYEYEVVKYDRQTREGGLLAGYVNTFLKLKAEASGYPSWVRTPKTRNDILCLTMVEKACC